MRLSHVPTLSHVVKCSEIDPNEAQRHTHDEPDRFYTCLSVPRDATVNEIRQAYKQKIKIIKILATKFHSIGEKDMADQEFRRVRRAHAILTSDKRVLKNIESYEVTTPNVFVSITFTYSIQVNIIY